MPSCGRSVSCLTSRSSMHQPTFLPLFSARTCAWIWYFKPNGKMWGIGFFFFKATSKRALHRLYTWRSDYLAWTKWYNARCESEVWENKITHHLNIRDYLSITGSQIHSQVLRSKTWAFVRRRESDERWYQVALWGKEVFFRSLTHAREWKSGCVSAVCSLSVWTCTTTLLEGALKGAICKKTFNK